MVKTLTLLLLITITSANSQTKCDCVEILNYVSSQIESNSASYAHQVIEYGKKIDYSTHKKSALNLAKKTATEKECLGVIQFYLSYLRDNHQKLEITNSYYPFKTFEDGVAVRKFITQNLENFKIKGTTDKGILGTWCFDPYKTRVLF